VEIFIPEEWSRCVQSVEVESYTSSFF